MDIQRLKRKLGLTDGDGFASLSGASPVGVPYVCNVYGGDNSHFTFESDSLEVRYYTDNESEMLVAIRDTIKDFEAMSKVEVISDKIYRWESGPVNIEATRLGTKSYKMVRNNKMVGSVTELSRLGSAAHILSKVGMHPPVDIRLSKPQEALYLFLANFESTRIDRNDLKESLNWSYKIACLLEGVVLKLPAKIDGSTSGMIARKVKVLIDDVEHVGVLLNVRSGLSADVLVDNLGIKRVPKTDIWI